MGAEFPEAEVRVVVGVVGVISVRVITKGGNIVRRYGDEMLLGYYLLLVSNSGACLGTPTALTTAENCGGCAILKGTGQNAV